jgi:hypothetical protein
MDPSQCSKSISSEQCSRALIVKSIIDVNKPSGKSSQLPEIALAPTDSVAMNTPTYWARNIASGLGSAILYAAAGKLSGSALRGSASALNLEGKAAQICASEMTAQITGAAVWDFTRKPNQGETRFSNSVSGATSFLFFELGNARLKTSLSNKLLSSVGHVAIGAGGGMVQHITSDVMNGRRPTSESLLETAINGGAMNLILPHTQRLIGKGIDVVNLQVGRGVPVPRIDLHLPLPPDSASPTLSQLAKENPLARVQLFKSRLIAF